MIAWCLGLGVGVGDDPRWGERWGGEFEFEFKLEFEGGGLKAEKGREVGNSLSLKLPVKPPPTPPEVEERDCGGERKGSTLQVVDLTKGNGISPWVLDFVKPIAKEGKVWDLGGVEGRMRLDGDGAVIDKNSDLDWIDLKEEREFSSHPTPDWDEEEEEGGLELITQGNWPEGENWLNPRVNTSELILSLSELDAEDSNIWLDTRPVEGKWEKEEDEEDDDKAVESNGIPRPGKGRE